jgi:hypothetical protein
MRVAVHFGAHKTATTLLQNFLLASKGELRRQGLGYIPLHVSRKALFPAIGKLAAGHQGAGIGLTEERVRRQLLTAVRPNAQDVPPLQRLLISDENLSGPLSALWKGENLYADGPRRLLALKRIFPDSEFDYFCCIRTYADFAVSAYCEVLRHRKLASFESLLAGLKDDQLSWTRFLEQVQKTVGVGKVLFWCYEDFVRSQSGVVESLTGVNLAKSGMMMDKRVRSSLSKKAVAIIQAAEPYLSDAEHVKLANYLAEKFPFEDDGGKLTIADSARAGRLSERYARDLAELTNRSVPETGIVRRLVR